jgi:hypothetical protein
LSALKYICRLCYHHRQAKIYTEECKTLATLLRRLQPLLQDLEDNVLDAAAAKSGIAALQVRYLPSNPHENSTPSS